MNIPNEEIQSVLMEVPERHRHLRTTVLLQDGTEFTFQEATIAGIVRAYTTIKTHPVKKTARLKGHVLSDKKPGFADWQLLEE
jgi:hypothetical protein